MKLTIPIDAIPQKGASFGKGHAHKPDAIRKYQADFTLMVRSLIRGHEKFTGAVKVELNIRRNKKSPLAKNFGDVDNLAKPILDAITATGAVWLDDRQIVDLRIIKAAAPEPSVEISIEEAINERN